MYKRQLIDLAAGDLPGDDLAKQTIGHTISSFPCSISDKLMIHRIIPIVQPLQGLAQGRPVCVQRAAQLLQTGILIPKLRIYLTQKYIGIFGKHFIISPGSSQFYSGFFSGKEALSLIHI